MTRPLHSAVVAILTTLIGVHAAAQTKTMDRPPLIANIGSYGVDGTITITCEGTSPYRRLACHAYRLWIDRTSAEKYKTSRAALEADLSTGKDQLKELQKGLCSSPTTETQLAARVKDYAPGRAASARAEFAERKTLCGCATKECYVAATLLQQTHDQDFCDVNSVVFSMDFVKVGARKWVSNNGPEGACGTLSVFTIEHEVNDPVLWNYTEHYSYTNNTTGFLCKGLKDETHTYSWRVGGPVQLSCEKFRLATMPDFH